MKFNASDFLRAATMAAHGTIAGHIQGQQEREAEQQQQFGRDLSLFHLGNQLEQQQNERDDNYDQGVASVLPHLNPADRAAWTQTLLQRKAARAQAPGRFGAGQLGGALGFPQAPGQPAPGAPPAQPSAVSAGPRADSGQPTASPSPLQLPPSMAGVGMAPPTPTPAPPPTAGGAPAALPGTAPPAAGGASGAPAAAPPPQPGPSPVQLHVMQQAMHALSPFVPGAGGMLQALDQYHPPMPAGFVGPPTPGYGPPTQAAPGMAGGGAGGGAQLAPGTPTANAAPTPAPMQAGSGPATGAPKAAPTATEASATQSTTPAAPDQGTAINIPGFPTAHLDAVEPKVRDGAQRDFKDAVTTMIKAVDVTPETRQQIANIQAAFPKEINTEADLQQARTLTAELRNMAVGSGATNEAVQERRAKALDAQAHAIPTDNGVAVDVIDKLARDFQHHNSVYGENSTLPNLLASSAGDITEMLARRKNGDQAGAEEIASMIRGRLANGVSPTQESKRVGFVYKDLANLSPADANNPKIVREIYKKNGVGYLVADTPDEALKAGGARAEKGFQSLLKAAPSWAKLKPEDQAGFIGALGEAAKEAGVNDFKLPASLGLAVSPLAAKRLIMMDKQIAFEGTREEIARAHLNIERERFKLDQQRFAAGEKKLAQIGKTAGDKTWNRTALMYRDNWTRATTDLTRFLGKGGANNIEEDPKMFNSFEKGRYADLVRARDAAKHAYYDFFTQHGIAVPPAPSGTTNASTPTKPSQRSVSEMSVSEAAAELAQLAAKLPHK